MAEDSKNTAANEPREIPIEGSEPEEAQAASSAAADEAEAVEAEVIESEEPSFADQVEADVAAAGAEEDAVSAADQIAAAQAEAAAAQDKYLRLQAEWNNFRKRTAEENASMRKRATENLVSDVLPVLDDFERAIGHAEQAGEAGLLDGVKAISNKLNEILSKHGLETIDPAGQPYDANEHQVVATVPDDSVPDETVAQVYQKGYRMGGHVLRAAMVVVTSA